MNKSLKDKTISGLVWSFVDRELCDLTRYKKELKGYETSEKNRIIKILEDANIKVSTYMSNVFGVSRRKMLEALVNGEAFCLDVKATERCFLWVIEKV